MLFAGRWSLCYVPRTAPTADPAEVHSRITGLGTYAINRAVSSLLVDRPIRHR
jgi:hypothetical protein